MRSYAWTTNELEFLTQKFPSKGSRWVAEALNRTVASVEHKAQRLGLRSKSTWTKAEVEFCQEHYPSKGTRWVAQALGRTEASVNEKVGKRQLGLKTERDWTDAEVEFLKQHPMKGAAWIALQLERTKSSVNCKAERLGVSIARAKTLTQPELQVMRALTELEIFFEQGHRIKTPSIGYVYPDFLLENHVVVEVQGDYWHYNSAVYTREPDAAQQHVIARDALKREFYLSAGYILLEIWEADTKDLDNLKATILKLLERPLNE